MPHSVISILKNTPLKTLALSSNLTYGTAMYERDAVELVKVRDDEVEAWAGGLSGSVKAGGGSRRHVWLWAKDDALISHCSGNPKNHDIFCKHCVAVALKICAEA